MAEKTCLLLTRRSPLPLELPQRLAGFYLIASKESADAWAYYDYFR
jgi:hypothetical protein